jgi:flagellar hook assembly protein FlgD
VAIDVYDLRGARVAGLVRGPYPAGRHKVTWDGRTAAGQRAAAGIYFVVLNASGVRQVRKLAVAH